MNEKVFVYISKFAVVGSAILVIILCLLSIASTGALIPNRDGYFYEGNLCENTVFNQYRPFRVFFEPTNSSYFKICAPTTTGYNVTCYPVETSVDNYLGFYCGYRLIRSVQHIGVDILVSLFCLPVLIWVFKEKRWWALSGLFYTLGLILGLVGMSWVFVIDCWEMYDSQGWCQTYFMQNLCSPTFNDPSVFPEITQKCSCSLWTYVAAGPILHLAICGVLLLALGLCVVRWYSYKYTGGLWADDSTDYFDLSVTRKSFYQPGSKTSLLSEDQRLNQVYKSYGF